LSLSADAEFQPRSVLVLRPGALGDLILTVPALYSIRQHLPEARVEFMGPEFARDILGPRKLVSQIRSIEAPGLHTLFSDSLEPADGLARFLASFDWIISYWADAEGILGRQLTRCGARKVSSHPPKPPPHAREHVSAWLAAPLIWEGIPFRQEVPLLPATDGEQNAAVEFLEGVGLGGSPSLAIIHPGSGGLTKNWPAEHFAALAGRVLEAGPWAPVLIKGPADNTAAKALRSFPGLAGIPWVEDPPLPLLIGLLSVASVYAGNDSGVTHLAAAVGCPCAAIFGPTDPTQWGPVGPNVEILGPCPDLSRIQPDEVYRALLRLGAPPPQAC